MGAATTLTAQERTLRARMAGLTTAALHSGKAMTKPARAGFRAKFEREVEEANPGLRERDPSEFERSVERAKKAFYSGMSKRSWQVRREQQATAARTSECPVCVEARGDRPTPGAEQKRCSQHAKAERMREARLLNAPGSSEAVTLRARMDALEAMFETLIFQAIAADADRLTEIAMASITRDMRPTPDPSDLAA